MLPVRSRVRISWIAFSLLNSFSLWAQTPALPREQPPDTNLKSQIEQAEQAFNDGRYSEALRLFQRVQSESPACELNFYIGMTQYRLKHLDEAIAGFASAAACHPRFFLAERALGEAYLEKGDDNRALAALEAALLIEPDDAETLRTAAGLCLKHELNERAIPLLERLVRLEPRDAEARADLGAAYGATGEMEKAETQFRAALGITPQAPAAVLGLGALFLKTNRAEEAVPLLLTAARLEPHEAKPLYLLGSAYNRLGRYTEAVTALEKAIPLAPEDADVYYQLAHAYGHLQKTAEKQKALARFTEIKSRGQKLFESQREAARLVKEVQPSAGQPDSAAALEKMERAYRLDPENEEVWFRLANLYYDTQKYDLAHSFAERLVVRAPSEWRYHYILGLVLAAMNRWDEARKSFEQVVRLNQGMAEAYNELGNLAMRVNQPASAVKAYQRALASSPHNALYKQNLEAAQRAATRRD
ncbi:MAG TPA: tetratricopeptide repeat protein [Terriglobia bacterium]|nr:tetratricopeptide repeat protein [Terriglobia bacterium]